jgi:hypothetical protein
MRTPTLALLAPTLLLLGSGAGLAAQAVQPGHTGLWYDPENDGHGLFIHVISPQQAAASWNVFRPDGSPMWLFGDGHIDVGRIVFDAFEVAGGTFPPRFGEQRPELSSWGQFIIDFVDCNSARLRWESNQAGFQPDEIPLTRLSFAAGSDCAERGESWHVASVGTAPAPVTWTTRGHFGVVSHGEVIVTSTDGLWRRPIRGGDWQRSGLDGVEMIFIQEDPSAEGRLFAGGRPSSPEQRPFFWSADGGRTWRNASTGIPTDFDDPFEPIVEVAVHPRHSNILFGALFGGEGVAWSIDGGRNWTRADGHDESRFGYSCHLTFLDDQPDRLYQGCELGLDIVHLLYYPLDLEALVPLGAPVYLASTANPPLPDPSNRRPNMLKASPARPGVLYAGLEGALVAMNRRGEMERIFWVEDGNAPDALPYLYVSALWINPRDPSHIIFGGGINGENEFLGLYETFDHGRTLKRLPEPEGVFQDPYVDSIVALDERGHELVVFVADRTPALDNPSLRVLRYSRQP